MSIKERVPLLLGISSIVGLGATVGFAIHDTRKAEDIIFYKEEDIGRVLSFKEKVQLTWKCYIPTAVCFVGTGCLMGASLAGSETQKKVLSAIASAAEAGAAITENQLIQYKEAVKEKVDAKLLEEIDKTKVERNFEKTIRNENIDEQKIASMIPSKLSGHELIYDNVTGQFFDTASKDDILDAERQINCSVITDPFDSGCSCADFYEIIGENVPNWAYSKGWRAINADSESKVLRIKFDAICINKTPILTIDYDVYNI